MGFSITYPINDPQKQEVVEAIYERDYLYSDFIKPDGGIKSLYFIVDTNKYRHVLAYVTTSYEHTDFEVRAFEGYSGSFSIAPWDGEKFLTGTTEKAIVPGTGYFTDTLRLPVHEAFPQMSKGIHTLDFRIKPLSVPVEFNDGNAVPNKLRILILGVK